MLPDADGASRADFGQGLSAAAEGGPRAASPVAEKLKKAAVEDYTGDAGQQTGQAVDAGRASLRCGPQTVC